MTMSSIPSTLLEILQATVEGSRIDVTSRWWDDWQLASEVNSSLVADLTIRLPGFDLHQRQWSLLNRFQWVRDTVMRAARNGVSLW